MTDTPDTLSDWTLPPPAARESGDAEPIRVFDTAEAALRFLSGHDGSGERPGREADQGRRKAVISTRVSNQWLKQA